MKLDAYINFPSTTDCNNACVYRIGPTAITRVTASSVLSKGRLQLHEVFLHSITATSEHSSATSGRASFSFNFRNVAALSANTSNPVSVRKFYKSQKMWAFVDFSLHVNRRPTPHWQGWSSLMKSSSGVDRKMISELSHLFLQFAGSR